MNLPLSSRTRDSSSAILFLRRVLSSIEGSSLDNNLIHVKKGGGGRRQTWVRDRRFHIHIILSVDLVSHLMHNTDGLFTNPSWMHRWQGRFRSHCIIFRKTWKKTKENVLRPCAWMYGNSGNSVSSCSSSFSYFWVINGCRGDQRLISRLVNEYGGGQTCGRCQWWIRGPLSRPWVEEVGTTLGTSWLEAEMLEVHSCP